MALTPLRNFLKLVHYMSRLLLDARRAGATDCEYIETIGLRKENPIERAIRQKCDLSSLKAGFQ